MNNDKRQQELRAKSRSRLTKSECNEIGECGSLMNPSGGIRDSFPCYRPIKFWHEGQGYCGIHKPKQARKGNA